LQSLKATLLDWGYFGVRYKTRFLPESKQFFVGKKYYF